MFPMMEFLFVENVKLVIVVALHNCIAFSIYVIMERWKNLSSKIHRSKVKNQFIASNVGKQSKRDVSENVNLVSAVIKKEKMYEKISWITKSVNVR